MAYPVRALPDHLIASNEDPRADRNSALVISSTEDGYTRVGHGQAMFLSQQEDRLQMRNLKTEVLDHNPPDGSKRGPA
jgi:hypothetical protein